MGFSVNEFLVLNKERSAFYTKQAKNAHPTTVKRLLEHLAKEELENANRFYQIWEQKVAATTWPKEINTAKMAVDIESAIKTLLKFSSIQMDANDDEIPCLEKAITIKTEALVFFSSLTEQTTIESEYYMFAYLTKMERDHMVSMKQSLEYLEYPCTWIYPL